MLLPVCARESTPLLAAGAAAGPPVRQSYNVAMLIDAIDHVVLPVLDLAGATEPFERLGFTLSPRAKHAGQGTENRALFAGTGQDQFYVEFLAVHDEAEALAAGREGYLRAAREGAGLNRLVLRTQQIARVRSLLEQAGVSADSYDVFDAGGAKVCTVLPLGADRDLLGCRAAVIQYEGDLAERFARREANGLTRHGIQLERLDHLAMIAPEAEVTERFWSEILGVEVTGEVPGRGMVIRQLKIGDAIVELLVPTDPESPLHQRPGGLASMCAYEVGDVDSAIAFATECGFTASAPGPGPLPGTRVATIPGAQLSGLSLQLLQYV